ncbi:MAG: DinB family protein [Promethearchaeota archaeon]
MSKLESAKQQLDYTLNHAMKTLDKAILLIPDDKLNWKPAEDAKSAGELGIHVYMGTLAHFAGALKGEFSDEDFSMIPFDSEKVKSASEIVEYGEKVKSYVRENLPALTDADMEKIVTYHCWDGFKFGSYESLVCNLEETIHHRGQLCTYLRMLGIKPPFIYDI